LVVHPGVGFRVVLEVEPGGEGCSGHDRLYELTNTEVPPLIDQQVQ
jgi:hypothetical protein